MAADSGDPQSEKLELEKKKLEFEIADLRRPYYHRPTFWISVATALAALVGVVGQSFISTIKADRAKIAAEQAKLDADKAAKRAQEAQELEQASIERNEQLLAETEALEGQLSEKEDQLQAARSHFASLKGRIEGLAERASAEQTEPLAAISESIDVAQRAIPPPTLVDCTLAGDADHFVAVGRGGGILVTRDGGQSWEASRPGSERLLGICSSDDGRYLCAVGDHGAILVSQDSARTWQLRNSGSKTMLAGVSCSADGTDMWAVGGQLILGSHDHGMGWSVSADRGFTLRAVHASDGRIVCAGGQEKQRLRGIPVVTCTNDGGESWELLMNREGWQRLTEEKPSAPVSISALFAPRYEYDLWALVRMEGRGDGVARPFRGGPKMGLDDSRVKRYPAVLRFWSNEGTWEYLSGVRCPGAEGLFVASGGSRLWVAGHKGVTTSRDGGRTWEEVTLPVSTRGLNAICGTPDGQTLWAVGREGMILKSSDTGETWRRIPYPQ